MAVQQTSLMTYALLRKEGTLAKMQALVLELIRRNPDATDHELAYYAGVDCNTIRPRRNELVKKGFVAESGQRDCKITGRLAMTWRET